MRTHRRTLPRAFKNKWLTATMGVAVAGLVTAGIVAAPSVFAQDHAKVALWRVNTPQSIAPGTVGYLRGFVKTPGGKPIAGAPVVLSRTLNGGWSRLTTGKTDAQGVVTFRIAPSVSSYYSMYWAGGQGPADSKPSEPKPATPERVAKPMPKIERSNAPKTDSGTGQTTPDQSGDQSNGQTNGQDNSGQNGGQSGDQAGTEQTNPPAQTQPTTQEYGAASSAPTAVYVQDKGAQIVSTAAKQKGKPYRYGAAGPHAFDCSGLTQFVFKKFGKTLPHSATSQARYGKAISRSAMKPGDLLLFGRSGSYYHAAIYAGGNTMWEAQTSGKPVGKHKIWSNNYVVRRLI